MHHFRKQQTPSQLDNTLTTLGKHFKLKNIMYPKNLRIFTEIDVINTRKKIKNEIKDEVQREITLKN